jgi:hypothetical protein
VPTNIPRAPSAIALAACVVAIAAAWCGAAAARIGLAPVVADTGVHRSVAPSVERAIMDYLRLRGINPPSTSVVGARLALTAATEKPTTAECVDAGKKIGIDLLLLIRVRAVDAEGLQGIALRVVDVDAGSERGYERRYLRSDPRQSPRSLSIAGAQDLVAAALADFPAREQKLAAVEAALKRDCDEEYAAFLGAGAHERPFADQMYLDADNRRVQGIVMGIAIPITLVAITTTVLLAAFRPWTWNDHQDTGAGVCVTCGIGEAGRDAGFAIVAIVGYGLTFATLAGGLHMYSEGKSDLERLRPLVPNPPKRERVEMELSMAPWGSPTAAGLAMDLRF